MLCKKRSIIIETRITAIIRSDFTAFAASIVIIQASCSKAEARPTSEQINKLLYVTYNGQIWTADFDGSNKTQVNLALPSDLRVDVSYPKLSIKMSPDGQKIFFSGINTTTNDVGIYSCDISGSNIVLVLSGSPGTNQPDQPILCGAY